MTESLAANQTRRRRRPVGPDRGRVVDAVCEVIAQVGWEKTRFADVATRADVSIGSLQYLFGSREDMIAVALESRTQQFFEDARNQAATFDDPLQRLRWIASSLATGTNGDESAGTEWMMWTEYWRAALRDDALREVAVQAYHAWVSLVSDAIWECISAGQVPVPASVASVATSLVALGDGLGVQVSLGATELTWNEAGALVRARMAEMLACPELA